MTNKFLHIPWRGKLFVLKAQGIYYNAKHLPYDLMSETHRVYHVLRAKNRLHPYFFTGYYFLVNPAYEDILSAILDELAKIDAAWREKR